MLSKSTCFIKTSRSREPLQLSAPHSQKILPTDQPKTNIFTTNATVEKYSKYPNLWATDINTLIPKSRDSSVGIVTGYGLDDRGFRVPFPARDGNFSLHHRLQNGSEAHPASYLIGISSSFPGGKAAGSWSWPLTSTSCRGQIIRGAIRPLLQYAFIAWCLVKAQRQLYLYL
jgi:hypothetical protein